MTTIYQDHILTIELEDTEKEHKILTFNGTCKIENITLVQKALEGVITDCSECLIQFSEKAEIDLSTIQLFHALNTSYSQKDIDIRISGELPLSVFDAFKFSGYDKFEWVSVR